MERKVKQAVLDMFEKLANGQLSQDNPPVVTLPYSLSFEETIDEQGHIPENWGVPLNILPTLSSPCEGGA
jgi:hypothetical protein